MEYINSFIFPFITAIAGAMATYIWGLPQKRKKEKELEEKNQELVDCRLLNSEQALKALLRSDIQKAYDKAQESGFVTTYVKQNVSYLYKAYDRIGGNSYITKLYDELMRLPVQVEKEREES